MFYNDDLRNDIMRKMAWILWLLGAVSMPAWGQNPLFQGTTVVSHTVKLSYEDRIETCDGNYIWQIGIYSPPCTLRYRIRYDGKWDSTLYCGGDKNKYYRDIYGSVSGHPTIPDTFVFRLYDSYKKKYVRFRGLPHFYSALDTAPNYSLENKGTEIRYIPKAVSEHQEALIYLYPCPDSVQKEWFFYLPKDAYKEMVEGVLRQKRYRGCNEPSYTPSSTRFYIDKNYYFKFIVKEKPRWAF